MDRILKGSSGFDVAYRIDGDRILKGSSGFDVAYRIDGDRILKGSSGYDVTYRIDGDRILIGSSGFDVVYRVDGNRILKGSSGYDVVFRLDPGTTGENPGCLATILIFFVSFFKKLSLAGKIGAGIGFVSMIISGFSGKAGNVILFAPIGLLIGGGIGTFVGFINRKASREGRIGALIGAGIVGLFFLIGCIITKINFASTVPMVIAGIVFGSIVGIIIGSIVGAIKKQTNTSE
jgi:Ca2+-binding RTX toxin-like protein